ncbi:hypothetical protein C1M53_20220 [Mesorhizobium sp. Pch-S]|nr:hypothetical protein C1M53_20220 [Mesorhizobium sp. Pch-S]
MKAPAGWPRAFPFFTETPKRSTSLFLRNSGRKTAAHFSWTCSRSQQAHTNMAGVPSTGH